ncbi:Uncharacterised protein [Vibrio cholerae]|nr:Uncharacterised protein [Vibrio cholerae]
MSCSGVRLNKRAAASLAKRTLLPSLTHKIASGADSNCSNNRPWVSNRLASTIARCFNSFCSWAFSMRRSSALLAVR